MLQSMTGFSSGTIEVKTKSGKLALVVEMKTINSRYFEATCKLPMALSSLETKIVSRLQSILSRGRLYLTVRFSEESEVRENISPSLNMVDQYVRAIETLKSKFNLSGSLSISDVIALPNVFEQGKNEFDEQEEATFLEAIEQVAQKLIQTRLQEGDRLLVDLQKRFATCAQKIGDISVHFEQLMQEQKDLVDKQLALVQSGDEQAKHQLDDLCISLNKMDIHEEITRFNSHLAGVRDLLHDKKPQDKGKRFDFILQELLREVNTLMAKCSHFSISSLSVDIKVELEKIREQIQNIV